MVSSLSVVVFSVLNVVVDVSPTVVVVGVVVTVAFGVLVVVCPLSISNP